jgi:hypothetical protein
MRPSETLAHKRDLLAWELLGACRSYASLGKFLAPERIVELLTEKVSDIDARMADLDTEEKVAA